MWGLKSDVHGILVLAYAPKLENKHYGHNTTLLVYNERTDVSRMGLFWIWWSCKKVSDFKEVSDINNVYAFEVLFLILICDALAQN